MKCEKHGVVSTFCKFCDADIVDANDNKPRMIEVSESALDALKAMAEQAQREMDELIKMAHNLCISVNTVAYCYDKRPENFAVALLQATDEANELNSVIEAMQIK